MNENIIRTERLVLRMASDDEMRALIEEQTVDELKAAYSEMLEGALKNPEMRQWYVVWRMELHDGTYIGDYSFKGMSPEGMVEIGYGVSPEYEGKGYATEAVSAATVWASKQPGVTRIEAETLADNIASQRVLEKSGYVPTGAIGEEGPRFLWKNK